MIGCVRRFFLSETGMRKPSFSIVYVPGLLAWGDARSAGPDFSPMRNRGKNRQRRGLPPPLESTPPVLVVPASLYRQPLARWGHIDGLAILWGVHPLGARWYSYRQGLTLVCSCSQLPIARLPAERSQAGKPASSNGRGTATKSVAAPLAHFTRSFFTSVSSGVTYTVL